MIDLNNFYKFEVGVGVVQENMDIKLLAYAKLPDGAKIVGSHIISSRTLELSRVDEFKLKLHELLHHVLMQVVEKVELHEQSTKE